MKKRLLPLIIGNWKTFPSSYKEAVSFVKKLDKKVQGFTSSKQAYSLAVPDIFIPLLKEEMKRGVIGAQNISGTILGATTGETTASMLASAGASFVIVGHSEVRARGETTDIIAKKTALALGSKLYTILCIGEAERDKHGHYLTALEEELKACLLQADKHFFSHLILAYEPIWAVGANTPATVAECFEVVIALRRALAQIVGMDHAKKVSIIYGGTVQQDNALAFLQEGGVDGLLIGRASCDVDTFSSIIKETLVS